jgi:hypothetical protein
MPRSCQRRWHDLLPFHILSIALRATCTPASLLLLILHRGRPLSLLCCDQPIRMSSQSKSPSTANPTPSPVNYILSFLIVGLCWGFTTPFIRKAAITYQSPSNPSVTDPKRPWLLRQIAKTFFSIIGLLRRPRYAIPLVLNLTGSIWFFLLVGQAGKLRESFASGLHSLNT